jgi:hypothetical protein
VILGRRPSSSWIGLLARLLMIAMGVGGHVNDTYSVLNMTSACPRGVLDALYRGKPHTMSDGDFPKEAWLDLRIG